MKTLSDHTIIYDEECPLCQAYTGAFVKLGMLDSEGREPYHKMVGEGLTHINWVRARNEIALINKKDHSITYGNDSLLRIIGFSMPWVQKIFRFRPFRFLLDQLYFFISFNRKVIAPGKVFEGQGRCTPDFNYPYRWAYIVLAWILTSLVLVAYVSLLNPLILKATFTREFLVCAGQIGFQGIIVAIVNRKKIIHYLGNMMTVSLLGAILLTPALFLSRLTENKFFFMGYFLSVVGVMLVEHMRRIKILGLPRFISTTWVIYNLIAILFQIH